MDKNIILQKTVAEKADLRKVVDTNFSSFATASVSTTDNLSEFFRLYGQLYYEIPIEGEKNSHTYLVQESSKLVEFDQNTQDIQPLLDEITELRERLLESQQQIVELQTQQITNVTG